MGAVVGGVVICVVTPERADAGGEAALGQRIAGTACSGCHQVRSDAPLATPGLDEDNKQTGTAPSFPTIAADYCGDGAGLSAVMPSAHYPKPEPEIAAEDLDTLVAYILSLYRPVGGRR